MDFDVYEKINVVLTFYQDQNVKISYLNVILTEHLDHYQPPSLSGQLMGCSRVCLKLRFREL